MAVFAGSQDVLAVIDMKDRDLVLSQPFVKLFHNAFKIRYDIVTCVIHVTGIKAYP